VLDKEGKMAFRFEHLEIWRLANEYADMIHRLVMKFPKREMYGLASDLNRASISISSNIAEGSGSDSRLEFNRFLGIAVKSLFESVSQIFIARRRDYITTGEFETVYERGVLLAKKIRSLRKRLIH
jgi:four helix bundle protein